MKQHEMGSGPLSLSEYDHDHMTLVKNNAYFGEKAKSTTVRLNFVNDIGARVQMLEAGAVDIARVLPSNRSTLAADPDLTVLPNLTSFGTSFIALNEHISPGARYGIGDIPDDFFADVNVRLAFAHAFNQTKFIQQVSTGDRTSLDSLVPAGIAGYDPTIASYDYNLQKVADFLKVAQDHRAGHVGSYADNGFTLILYGYLGGTASQAVVNEFAQAFAAISANPAYGVTGTITVSAPPLWLDFPSYLINLFGGMLPTGITGFVPQYGDPGEYSISMLRTGGRLASVSGMSNASLDAKIDVMSVEMNVNARLSEIRNISLECQKNAYYIWAGQAMRLAAMGSNVTGFAWSPVWDEPIGTLHDLAIYAPAPVTVAPANLVVMPGNTTADLTWDAVTETQILYYQIYRGTSAGSLEMLVATQVTNFHDTGLTNGQTYYYAVAAVGPSGEGPMCAPSSAVPHAVLPVAPADYTLAIAGLVVIAAVIVTVFVVIRVRRPKAP
jgi:ABC-type transport system substrate-binding protein